MVLVAVVTAFSRVAEALEVRRGLRWPWATITVVGITAVVTSLQFARPAILHILERTPDGLAQGQYWRVITPLLVHSDGWHQIAFNFPAIAIVGSFAERVFGARIWLIVYFVSGFTGEIAGYAWQPRGAGASVAGAGLLGALALWVLLRVPVPQPKLGALFVLLGAVILTAMHDIHGPPILTGACIALLATWPAKRQRDEAAR